MIKVDKKGLQNALEKTRKLSRLTSKPEKIVDRLARIAIQTINEAYQAVVTGYPAAFYDTPSGGYQISIENTSQTSRSVVVSGETVLFIEYGAGVRFNTPQVPRPAGVKNIGEYGKGYGKRRGWVYRAWDGSTILTRGNPAAVGVPKALEAMRRALPKIVREVLV